MYEQSATMAKQMIDLQRIGVEGMISNMIMFWDQTDSMLNAFLNQAAWVPDEGKKMFREWVESNKKGCETLKDVVNNGYSSLGKYFEKKE
jgi:hypothetical protein